MRYDKKDCYIFISLVTVILLLSLISLDNTCYWGDDWAGYISEGISIAEGRLNEQAKLNVIMHPSELPDEALNGSLVYVWGYPLLMALVYKLVGFDRVGFTSIIYYKIPSAIALALLAGIMYLFLRRRSGKALSFLLSFLFCACYEFRVFINTLYSDMIFLFFAMLSLLLVEVFLDERQRAGQYIIGFALGVSLWFTYEVRLNGISILFACIVACLVFLIRNRHEQPDSFTQRHKFPVLLFPFAIFILLKLISEEILAPATGNTSDLSAVTLKTLWDNLVMYYNGTRKWLSLVFDDALINWINTALTSMTDTGEDTYGVIGQFCANLNSLLVTLFLLCTLVGFIIDGFRREIHLSIYALVYLTVVCMLPYNQGVRYVYPVMMLIPVYASYIYIYILATHRRAEDTVRLRLSALRIKNVFRIVQIACVICACSLTAISSIRSSIYEHTHSEPIFPAEPQYFYSMKAYSPCAIEAYNFISENTPKDAVIGFVKPRALYLNTERVSIRTDVNNHSLDEVDYFLTCVGVGEDQLEEESTLQFEPVFSNSEFTLYKKSSDK